MFVLILCLTSSLAVDRYCYNETCESCTDQKLNFFKTNCLDLCPFGFNHTAENNKCIDPGKSNKDLFEINFSQVQNYILHSIGDFNTTDNQSFNDTRGPIPTKDRGFYFINQSRLSSENSWALSPNFHLALALKIYEPGLIFSIKNDSNLIFSVSSNQSHLILTFKTWNGITYSFENLYIEHNSYWFSSIFKIYQSKTNLNLIRNYDKSFKIPGIFSPTSEYLAYSFGSLLNENNGFKGFLYYFILTNTQANIFNVNANLIPCSPSQYYLDGKCIECPDNGTWPICAFSSGSACFSPSCSKCVGYELDHCEDCKSDNNSCLTLKFCQNESDFTCFKCLSGYNLTNGLCMLEPTPDSTLDAAISINFGDFLINNSYFGWPSGADISDVDKTIPTPIKSRGYYFYNNSYIENKVPIIFNYSFTISVWVLSYNSNPFFSSETISIQNNAYMSIKLSNLYGYFIAYTNNRFYLSRAWNFMTFSVLFSDQLTTIRYGQLLDVYDAYSIQGYLHYDENKTVLIGCSNDKKECFGGFLYYLKIWQYYFKPTNYSIICKTEILNCVSYCDHHSYYNIWEKSCLACNEACKFGCTDWSNCRKCNEVDCISCSNNYNGTCLLNNSSNVCFEGLEPRNSSCCDPSCSSCYGPYYFKCLSCFNGLFLHNSMCMHKCPTGFKSSSSNCIQENHLILNLKFENISEPTYDSYSQQPVKFGGISEIPDIKNSSHPIPAAFRGYYFKNTSFITCPFISLSNFLIQFWIKIEVNGLIFSKEKLKIFSNGTVGFQKKRFVEDSELSFINLYSMETETWIMYSVAFRKTFSGKLMIKSYLNTNEQRSSSYQNFTFYDDGFSQVVLGNYSSSFQGFLWSFKIITYTNFVEVTNDFYIPTAYYNESNDYKSNCSLEYYFEGECKKCDKNCVTCVRSGDCVLCKDMKCNSCRNFTSDCTECFQDKNLDFVSGSCLCKNLTVWSQSKNDCENCPDLCLSCNSSSECLICVKNSININKTCVCETGYFKSNKLYCEKCSFECKTCHNSSESSCDSCVNNATLSLNRCICDEGYFRNGSSCDSCSRLCKYCNNSSQNGCTSCRSNLKLKSGYCECEKGFYWNETAFLCKNCHESCLDCKGPYYYQCSECFEKFYSLSGYCNEKCPLGYLVNSFKCENPKDEDPYVIFDFKQISSIFIDKVSGIVAKFNDYENFFIGKENTPIPAYARGLYFDGNGSFLNMTNLDDHLLFGPNFCISFWIYTEKIDSFLLNYENNQYWSFSLKIANLQLSANFFLSNEEFSYKSKLSLLKNQWNHLLFILSFTTLSNTNIKLNNKNSQKQLLFLHPFKDYFNSTFYLGSHETSQNTFQGFLYLFQLFVLEPADIKLFKTENCEGCSLCLTDRSCLPSCNISSFESQGSCDACLDSCTSGCRRNSTCSLCDDPHCLNCSDYQPKSCFNCEFGFELVNKSCFQCSVEEYYDSKMKKCIFCTGLCLTCRSEFVCLTCLNNSSLNEKGECLCDLGYSFRNGCERNHFSAFISIDFNNNVKITFTEELEKPIQTENLLVFINSTEISFIIDKDSKSGFDLKLKTKEKIVEGDKISIFFEGSIVSQSNSLLITQQLSINLHPTDSSHLVDEIRQSLKIANIGISLALGTSLGSSIFFGDPTFFFNFWTSIEIYSYVALFNLKFDSGLREFLNSIQVQSKIPNLFEYIITDPPQNQLDQKFVDFGYETNLLLLNSGATFTYLIIFVLCYPFTLLGNKVKMQWLSNKLTQIREGYHYKVFLRIYIQSFFDIFINSMLGIVYFKNQGILTIIDFSLCAICLGLQIFFTALMVKVLVENQRISEEESESFLKKFGTFFYEFKKDAGQGLLYLIFIVRRLTIVLLVLFIQPAILQLIISMIFSLAMIFFIVTLKPYKDTISGVYTICNESLTMGFYVYLILPFISRLKFTTESVTLNCVFIIIAALLLNVFTGVVMNLNRFYRWVKARKIAKVAPPETNVNVLSNNDKELQELEFKKVN